MDNNSILILLSAADWIEDNTTFVFDYENIEDTPHSIKLFMIKFSEIMAIPTGIASESIEGLSQSFETTNKTDLIWQYANELLKKWLKPKACFFQASSRWK